jgi:hypothetical protein
MEPEQLKVIAKGMGYETESRGSNGLEIISCDEHGVSHIGWYNPLTNAEQSWKGYKFLLDKGFVMAASEQDASYAIYLLGEFISEGKTPQEAVCNTLYKYFNNL